MNGVSLAVATGARLGLTGPSGSGKSTLAVILARFMPPDEPTVRIDEQAVRRWGIRAPRPLRRQVQMLWQSPRQATDPRMHLRNVAAEPLLANGEGEESPQRAAAALDTVGLRPELWERFPQEVAEGQLERACVARALVLGTRYLVCDESTSMLDVSTQAAVLRVIADAQAAADLGVVLITHDVSLARHWCDQVVDLRDPGTAEHTALMTVVGAW